MKQLLEFIPLILFFITYKLSGVRDAAIVLVVATIVQMIVLKVKYGKIEKQQLFISAAVVFSVYSQPISMKSNICNGK
ncbi:intracellular septation protein A-like protein [Haemophilus pittmaniae HK 85]|uniref:Intracellular septation protein A-like protein n=1 Tax=Haemophilus pittmaniae HK 85 TaxID=1035188 RepID=F9Q5S7_9PAST|nr:intracellular septation protein A-like protein [Haemophilus pittmaniae HK 85]